MQKRIIPAALLIILAPVVAGQNKDKAVYRESRPGFYQNSILKDDREVREKAEPVPVSRTLAVDLTGVSLLPIISRSYRGFSLTGWVISAGK